MIGNYAYEHHAATGCASARLGEDMARHVVVDVGRRAAPMVDGAPWWPAVATSPWLRQAGLLGLAAEDCTFEVIDWLRDGDREYAGSVRVGSNVFDLLVDAGGCVRVAPEGHYLV